MQKQIEMSTQQPEALEIASIFESWVKAAGEHRSGARSRGAKELHRLHARVQELEVINQQLSEQYDTVADCVTQLKAELVKEASQRRTDMTKEDQITEAQKEFENAWNESDEIKEFLYQNDIEGEDESMYFCAAWLMWKKSKGDRMNTKEDQIKEVMGMVKSLAVASTCYGVFRAMSNPEQTGAIQEAKELERAIESKLRELLPGWIDATKQKPEDGEQVWAIMVDSNGKSTFQAYAIWEDGDWFLDVMDSGDLYSRQKAIKDGLDACTVKCWMPLPKAPSE